MHSPDTLLHLTAGIVCAALPTTPRDVTIPDLIASTYAALAATGETVAQPEPAVEQPVAAATVRKSLASPDHILSMIDGKPYKTLRRHLATHGLSPVEYRERYGLPADYPMTAPAYAAMRSDIAKKNGLGRNKAKG